MVEVKRPKLKYEDFVRSICEHGETQQVTDIDAQPFMRSAILRPAGKPRNGKGNVRSIPKAKANRRGTRRQKLCLMAGDGGERETRISAEPETFGTAVMG